MVNTIVPEDARFNEFIGSVNKFTEISIAPIDDKWEWHWRCKESENSFETPEDALTDCINFICHDYEALLVASLVKEESIELDLEEDSTEVE